MLANIIQEVGVKKKLTMECIHCQNCKLGQVTYFCAAKNDFVIDTSKMVAVEKTRNRWKKGDPDYESHRRKVRQETDE